MSQGHYFTRASILVVVGVLALAETLAQQTHERNTQDINGTQDQLKSTLESRDEVATSAGANARGETKDNEAASPTPGEAPSGRSTGEMPVPRPTIVEVPGALFLSAAAKLTPIEKAYLDAYSILREDNGCSRFYGGPAAIEALNRLVGQMKPAHLDSTIGLRMTGRTSNARNYQTGLSYRLFEKVEVNVNGSFYRANKFPQASTISRVGEFSPNTREARLAILLHELGHLIQAADKHWLLPNDGDDPSTSRQNTQRVIDVCRDQIISQGRVSFERAWASVQVKPEAKPPEVAALGGPSQLLVANRAGSPDLLRQFGSQLEALCGPCDPEIQISQDH